MSFSLTSRGYLTFLSVLIVRCRTGASAISANRSRFASRLAQSHQRFFCILCSCRLKLQFLLHGSCQHTIKNRRIKTRTHYISFAISQLALSSRLPFRAVFFASLTLLLLSVCFCKDLLLHHLLLRFSLFWMLERFRYHQTGAFFSSLFLSGLSFFPDLSLFLLSFNPFFVCSLCNGYYREASTINGNISLFLIPLFSVNAL